MSKRYNGKSFKDLSVMKKAKLNFKEKRTFFSFNSSIYTNFNNNILKNYE